MSIQDKLQQLRIEWKQNPQRRSIIEEQVKILKLGEKYPKFVAVENTFSNNVRKALS